MMLEIKMDDDGAQRQQRLESLVVFSRSLIEGRADRALIEEHRAAIEGITPRDMVALQDRLMQLGVEREALKRGINRAVNIFYPHLKCYAWGRPEEGTFLFYLMAENRALEGKLNAIKKILKRISLGGAEDPAAIRTELLPRFVELRAFDDHYVKKENVLLPYLERLWESDRPLQIMWSLHVDVRRGLKRVIALLEDEASTWKELNQAIGSYFFLAFGMIQKEELVFFPLATETLTKADWEEMLRQSLEYGFPYIDRPDDPGMGDPSSGPSPHDSVKAAVLKTETGTLNLEQVALLLDRLPVDLTVVDDRDKVCFYNRPDERLFPRSPAIIGRDVRNCHPPESLSAVLEIIESFRSGRQEHARFWIQSKDKFVLIQYYALRTDRGEYRGVVEVSQEVSEIRALEGERRLVVWEK